MIIFPAVDILDGKAVRLKNGKYEHAKVYGDPLDMAVRWQNEGAKYLHIVDLNGARGDRNANCAVIEKIATVSELSIQVGGGIRDAETAERYLSSGAKRIILGSACVDNKTLVEDLVRRYGKERIICGIDARNGKVSVNGWLRDVDLSAKDACFQMKDLGADTVIYTDISKDGVLSGPDFDGIKDLILSTKLNIIASGGISTIEQLRRLKECGAYGAILGTALYENVLSLKDALNI